MQAIQTFIDSCKYKRTKGERKYSNNFLMNPWFNKECKEPRNKQNRNKRNKNIESYKQIVKELKIEFVKIWQEQLLDMERRNTKDFLKINIMLRDGLQN